MFKFTNNMNYIEFVTKVKDISSSPEVYREHGLDEDTIEEIIEGYEIKKISNGLPLMNDELLLLLANYNLSKTAIRMVEFINVPYQKDDRVIFGKFEVDSLEIFLPNGEIRCYENESTHLLWKCAKNGESFLSALYEAASFLEKRILNDELYENEDLGKEVAKHCAELAGGDAYLDFYATLLS